MFYLVAGARQVQLLNEMEVSHSSYSVREASLKCQIIELENEFNGLEQKSTLLVSEKVVVEEVRFVLESKLDVLTQNNEWLMIQNERFERDVCECDKLIADSQAEAVVAQCD